MTTINNKPWADQPFSLIASPIAKTSPPDEVTKIANEMVAVHNTFIRGLNSIILQAEQVPESEYSNFIAYCLIWVSLLELHHTTEEEHFFGALDKKYGQGTMQGSLDEHAAFHDGVDRFKAYLESFPPGKAKSFNGKTLVDLINAFARPLLHHFNSEITTILALSRFPEAEIKVIQVKMTEEVMKKVKPSMFVTDVPYIYRNNGITYEDGKNASFPPFPLPLRILGQYVFSLWHRKFWTFAPIDIWGKPKELVYASSV